MVNPAEDDEDMPMSQADDNEDEDKNDEPLMAANLYDYNE